MFSRSIALLALASAVAPVLSWDPFGHQTVGYVAASYFTLEARTIFSPLLNLGPTFDIGDAAAWADTVRDSSNLPWSKNWHFINPKGDDPDNHVCVMNYPNDCVKDNCIIAAIMNQTSILLDTSKPWINRRNATMFLLHFFGDLHQPMHTSGFKYGGNLVRPVCWGTDAPCAESTKSLHSVWDGAIPRKLRGLKETTTPVEDKVAAMAWADEIVERQTLEGEWLEEETCSDITGPKCVLGYAAESNKLVCSNALKNGERWVMGQDLSGEYFQENAKVVESQVGKAGWRLAGWMNAIARELAKVEVGDL
ncbi:S1/P1 nuclease [Podospora australis]|uniref:S1/P1 nuclease n=1 Tax=Podospora australis TaxID=1536484 RepID=A0AAN6WL21_9PEZI|nr:S1/P1 nuclease [Podospora australis]